MTHPLTAYIDETPGETRDAFAARAGISRMTLWRLTQGKGEFNTETLRRISKATGGAVSVADLVAALEKSKSPASPRPRKAEARA